MIPMEAVEAAARAAYEFRFSGFKAWEDLSEHERSEAIETQGFALEAAAAHMLAAHLMTLAADTLDRGDIGKDGGLEAWDYLGWKSGELLRERP